jgi:uncharacterized membrane protein
MKTSDRPTLFIMLCAVAYFLAHLIAYVITGRWGVGGG